MVVDSVCLSFVEGKDDQSTVIVEVGVIEQSTEPEIGPVGRVVNGGIVAVIEHVGRYENPLRNGRGVDIDCKVVEAANSRPAGVICGDRIVDDEGVMLAYVENIWRRRGVEVVNRRVTVLFAMSETYKANGSSSLESFVAVRGYVFLVRRPGDALCVQEIYDGGDTTGWSELGQNILRGNSLCRDVVKVIISKTEKVTTGERNVIRLRGMGYGIIVIEKNALRCEIRKEGLADKR